MFRSRRARWCWRRARCGSNTRPDGQNKIERLHATGGVTLVSGTDAAEAAEAVYTIASGEVVLSGDVLLTQGKNAMSGQKLTVNLATGTGTMDGRVRTVLQPGGN